MAYVRGLAVYSPLSTLSNRVSAYLLYRIRDQQFTNDSVEASYFPLEDKIAQNQPAQSV